LKGAAVLVKWKPAAEPAIPVKRDLKELESPAPPNILRQIAQPETDYRKKTGSLVISGRAWIHVPLDERLAALDKNGTIELIIKPRQQGGMPILVACTAPNVAGFRIAYDQRNVETSNQVLYSDQRVQSARMEYSIQVAGQSSPKPFSADVQQIAYVVRDGHGSFYRDGQRFSKQSETGKNGSLFRYTVRKNRSKEKLLISIGALFNGAVANNAFQGELFAVRIYDRPLSAGELRRNLASNLSR
jgi:hypothetical protein